MNINEKTNKDKIISHACELIDDKDSRINALQSQQTTLFFLLGLITVWGLIF